MISMDIFVISGVTHSDISAVLRIVSRTRNLSGGRSFLLPFPFNPMANDVGNARKTNKTDNFDEGVMKE
jgi:hypothetical protein